MIDAVSETGEEGAGSGRSQSRARTLWTTWPTWSALRVLPWRMSSRCVEPSAIALPDARVPNRIAQRSQVTASW